MASESINPVAGRPHKTSLFSVIAATDSAGILRHVSGLESFVIIENGGIKPAVIIGIRLDEKFIGKQLATVTEKDFEDVTVRTAALPTRKLRLQIRRHPEAEHQQDGQ